MYGRQRKRASGPNSASPNTLERLRKTRLMFDGGNHDRLLMLIYPPRDGVFLGDRVGALILDFLAFLSQMPDDFAAFFVVLNHAKGI